MRALDAIAERNLEGLLASLDNPNQRVNGMTLLGHAILYDNTEAMMALLEHGADPLLPPWTNPARGWRQRNHHLLLASVLPNRFLGSTLLLENPKGVWEASIGDDGVDAMMLAARRDMANNVREFYRFGGNPTRRSRRGQHLGQFVRPDDPLLADDVFTWQTLWPKPVSVAPRPCRQDRRATQRRQFEQHQLPLAI
jgi:hypothetical protein